MNQEKTSFYYNEITKKFRRYNIDIVLSKGRFMDSGETCFEYTEDEGFILFAYDRGSRSMHWSTNDFNTLILRLLNSQVSQVHWAEHRVTRQGESVEHKQLKRIEEYEKIISFVIKENLENVNEWISKLEKDINSLSNNILYVYNFGTMKFVARNV